MVKASTPPSVREETVRRFLKKTDLIFRGVIS